MLVKGVSAYIDHTFRPADISVKNGIIAGIYEPGTAPADDETIEASGLLAIPGLVDLHFHGAKGFDFCDATKEAVEALAKYEAANGVVAICPATMTYDEARITKVIEAALEYKNDTSFTLPCYAALEGINLEGPFISKNRIGAQNADYVIPPDKAMICRLLDKGQGLVKLIAIAPEVDGAIDCIRDLSDRVVFSVAHTESDYDTAKEAFECGASHVTHLYNAMPGLNHRAPGVIPAACEAGADAELISDGIHIHPAMVRMAFRIFGPERVILISDSMRACGLANGEYDLGGQTVCVEGRKAVLAEARNTIAGSVTNLFECMTCAISFGVSREDAVRAATENPARSIGIDDRYGKIAVGYTGHFLLVSEEMRLVRVL
jgi:N-acetylglucosamine-6-phosphate deacetylase